VILEKTFNKVNNLPFHIMFIANEVFFFFWFLFLCLFVKPFSFMGNTGKKRFPNNQTVSKLTTY